MFCNMCLKVWVAQVDNKRPNDQEEHKDSKSHINHQADGPLAEECRRLDGTGCERIHMLMAARSYGIQSLQAHANNGVGGESRTSD